MSIQVDQQRWENQFWSLIKTVVDNGQIVDAEKPGKRCREIENSLFTISNPLDRIIASPIRSLNITSAIARFVYFISGSDRINDIFFYEKKVADFSDDGLTLPGSNYGTRVFQPLPNVNQIHGVIQRIKDEEETKRAAAVVWQPADAVRESKDIPCTFGFSFSVRNGHLNMTTLMRSNAAYKLVPFNVFEFTLLQELVAVLTGHPLGKYSHFAISMHVYDHEQMERNGFVSAGPAEPVIPMKAMPSSTTWKDMNNLVKFGEQTRNASGRLTNTNYREYIHQADQEFDPYWAQFAKVLLAHALYTHDLSRAWHATVATIDEPIRSLLLRRTPDAHLEGLRFEENSILMESKLAWRQALEREGDFDEDDADALWDEYQSSYVVNGRSEVVGAARRESAKTVEDWRRMFAEKRGPQKSLFG